MFAKLVVPVLIASPSDVGERDEAFLAVTESNARQSLERSEAILLPLRWEALAPTIDSSTQAGINRRIVDKSDIAIVLFNRTLGQGNTKLEIDRLLDRGAIVLIYFKDVPDEERTQELRDLKSDLETRGLIRPYGEKSELRFLIRDHLSEVLPTVVGQRLEERRPVGRWLQVKSPEDTERPYAIVEISTGPQAGFEVRGRSYYADGKTGVKWPTGSSHCIETTDHKLIHTFDTTHQGSQAHGVTQYDFINNLGHYYQQVEGSGLPSERVGFRLVRLDDAFESFHLQGARDIDPIARDRRLIQRLHRNIRSPRIILTGGPCSGKTAVADYLQDKHGLASTREAAIEEITNRRAEFADETDYRAWADENYSELQHAIFNRHIQIELSTLPRTDGVGPVIMDRSGVDCAAYLRARDQEPSTEMKTYARHVQPYTTRVFVLDTLTDFQQRASTGRHSTFEDSRRLRDQIHSVYQDYAFSCTALPEFSQDREENIRLRAERILQVVREIQETAPDPYEAEFTSR